MRFLFAALLMGCLGTAQPLFAQGYANEWSVRYSLQRAHASSSNDVFTMQGSGMDFAQSIARLHPHLRLALVLDASGETASEIRNAGFGLSTFSLSAGPRISYRPGSSTLFVQGLVGWAHGFNSRFPLANNQMESSADSLQAVAGGGLEFPLHGRLLLRLPQIEYLYTGLPNNASNRQNSLRVSAGLAIRFHPRH